VSYGVAKVGQKMDRAGLEEVWQLEAALQFFYSMEGGDI